MDPHCEFILDEFREHQAQFEQVKDIIISELRKALDTAGIDVMAVEGRVKAEKSLEGKLERKGDKYLSLSDITDIVGVRIITYYSEDVDKIAAIFANIFDVDWDNSVDKRKMHQLDSFGYNSLHYICRMPKELYYNPEHPEMNDFRFEIQIRTLLQHMWSTINHDTGYKSDIEIPKALIRDMYRLAGVMELVDDEFSRLRNEVSEYRHKVASLLALGDFSQIALDGDTFKSYLEMKPFETLNKRIAAINQAEIQTVSLIKYLKVFKHLGFTNLGDIENLLKNYSDDAFKLAAAQIGGTDLDIIASNVSVMNLCVVYVLENGGGEHELINLFEQIDGPSNYNAVRAARMLDLSSSLRLSRN